MMSFFDLKRCKQLNEWKRLDDYVDNVIVNLILSLKSEFINILL